MNTRRHKRPVGWNRIEYLSAVCFIVLGFFFLVPIRAGSQVCLDDETCGFCGNEICETEESFSNCPLDCEPSVCGDFRCAEDEGVASCPDDCNDSLCGDFRCDPDESANDCADDCGGGCQTDADCDDANACNGNETCNTTTGFCVSGTSVVCVASDSCHDAGICNPATGQCSNPAKPNGALCSDGNACTQSDSCQNGACTGANPVICSVSNQCQLPGICNPGSGICSNPTVAPDGIPCNDAIICTSGDFCSTGICRKGKPDARLCTDNNKCTKDVCDADNNLCKHLTQKKCNEPF